MDSNKTAPSGQPLPNLAGDLLWFAAASVGAGLASAVAAGAIVILLA